MRKDNNLWEGIKNMSPENKNVMLNNETTGSITNGIETKFCESECSDIGKKEITDARLRASKKYYERHKEEIKQKARYKYKEKNEEKIWTLPCPKCKIDRIFRSHRWYKIAIKTNTCCHSCKKPNTYVDLVGKKFNRLLVIKKLDRTKDKHLRWLCKCDCGKETIIPGRNLTHNLARSCGCYIIDKLRKRPFDWIFNILKKTARGCGRDCTLTYEDFINFTKITNCHYCGELIKWKKHKEKNVRSAYYLDRKNNNVGYTKNNCVVCCTDCNRLKSNEFTHDEFLKIGNVLKEIKKTRCE